MPAGAPRLEANDIPLTVHVIDHIDNPPVQASRDHLLHDGGESEIDTPEEVNPPEPIATSTGRSLLPKYKFAVVSALGATEKTVTSRDAFGKEVTHTLKSKDVFEIEQRNFAERRLTESKNKWDPKALEGLSGWQKFGKRAERFFDRVWRGMGAEDAHRAKEKALGSELSSLAGIDSAISEEFHAIIDKEARKRVDAERKTKGKQFWGGVKDAWAEFRGARRDLHKHELVVMQELRAKYDANPANSDPVENPLYALVNRDVAAREALAARVNESDLELLKQTNQGDKKTTEAIKLEGEAGKKVETFLKQEIIGKAIDDFVTRADAHEHVTGIGAKLRRELDLKLQNYFMTDEFQGWVKTLPAEQQAMFENSFTYASDILLQTEEVMMPVVLQSLDHFKTNARLDFDMELCLGTAQLSANTEETRDNWFTKERASLDQKLMDRLRQDRNQAPQSRIYSTSVIQDNLKHERLMGYVNMIAKNEAVVAWAAAASGKAALTAARTGVSWLPVIGSGLVVGTASGIKEWARMGKMRSTYGFGVANGLEFPVADDAVRSEQMRAADYHRIQLGDRTQQFMETTRKFKDGSADTNTAFMAMVYDADSTARLKLNGERNINLLTASVDGPEGRGIHARELRAHDQARSANKVMLNTFLADDAKRNEIADLMGIPAGGPRDIDSLMAKLVEVQYNNLLSGTKVDQAVVAAISSRDAKLIREENEAIRARDKIFNGMRWRSSLKYGATSAVVAGVAGWGLGKFFNHEGIVEGTESYTATLINHTLPHHLSSMPTATITDDQGNVVVQTFAHLPAGTHLTSIQEVPGQRDFVNNYNLVADYNPDKILVHNIVFGDHGEIVNQASLQDDLIANHISLSPQNLHPVGWMEGGTETTSTLVGNTADLKVGDLEGYSEQGWWGWFNHTMSADGTAPRNPELNAVLKTFRGFEIWEKNGNNVEIVEEAGIPHRVVKFKDLADELFGDKQDVVAAAQSSNAVFRDIPLLWATPEGHEAIAKTFVEAETTFKADGTFIDEAHRIIYEAGIGGEEGVPDAAEMKVVLDYFGHLSTGEATAGTPTTINPVEYWFNLDQNVTTVVPVKTSEVFTQTVPDWWTHLAAAGYSHPLEAPIGKVATVNERRPYGIYGLEGIGGLSDAEIRQRFSPRLNANPNYIPDPSYEIPRYLNELATDNQEHWNELTLLDQQVNVPMDENVEAAVCLAVAGHQEHNNVYRTLETFAVQKDKNSESVWDGKNRFEINLLVNWPSGESPEKTIAEIERFKVDHPEVVVHTYKYEVTNGKKELGLWKKMVFDLALLRASRRSDKTKDVALVMNDADTTYSNPQYLDSVVRELDDPANRNYDAILGRQDLSPEIYDKYPTFHASMRFWQIMEAIMRQKQEVIGSQGRNTILRGSSYAAIGGNRTKDFWADVEFGLLLQKARGNRNPIKYSNRDWVMVDPRREVSKFLGGEPIAKTWFDFNTNENVRGANINFGNYTDVDPAILGAAPENSQIVTDFKSRLTSEVQEILNIFGPRINDQSFLNDYAQKVLGTSEKLTAEKLVNRTFEFMGIKAEVVNENENLKVSIIDTTKLRTELAKYKAEEWWKTKIKSNPLFDATGGT